MGEIYAKKLFISAFFLQRTHRSGDFFTLNTSNDAVLHKEVPFWVRKLKFAVFDVRVL